jgi:hypothetical protein
LQFDIVRTDEDGLKTSPVALDFEPHLDHLVNLADSLQLAVDLLAEFFDILLGQHAHESHLISIDEFLDLADLDQKWHTVVLLHSEDILFPSLADLLDFALNLMLLTGGVDEISDIVDVLMELELDKIIEAEAWLVVRNVALDVILESLPVTRLHEFGIQVLNKRHNLSHVLDAIIKCHEGLPKFDLLVQGTIRIAKV